MVVAVAGGTHFGSGEANLTARLPLMVRPSAPRFLNFGDRFELPVVVQNQTDEPLTVDVALQATNLELTAGEVPAASAGTGRRVTVPARDRVEVRFPATTVQAGTARFQVAAVSGAFADAATVELPVYTPATTEAFATYGVVDEGRHRPAAGRGRRWRLYPVRRPGDHHLLHGAPGADRRRALPGLLPLRVLRAVGVAHPGRVGPARRAPGLLGGGAALPGGDGKRRQARHRTAPGTAKRRRRLSLLEPRPRVEPVQHRPRGPCPAAGGDHGFRRAGRHAVARPRLPAADRGSLSRVV